jgi:hypothetical protein
MTARRLSPRVLLPVGALLVALIVAGTFVLIHPTTSSLRAAVSTSKTTRTSSAVPSGETPSVVADGQFLAEVTEADPSLATYEKQSGNVALQSLLTDGVAFCSFLKSDGDIDDAMVSVVAGAQRVETQTKFPMSVTTFNAVDAVALLALCPSLESSLPKSDLAKIRALGASLTP